MCYSNTGGFGIDGIVSTLIGASIGNKSKLFFCILGDLAFFYDMNSIGNRHVGNNIRIMVVNNGKGTEFRNFDHYAAQFSDEADKYIAAAGHYGNKSKSLLKHYAEDLGFEYLSASNKEEFILQIEKFTSNKMLNKPILFEVFTNSQNESDAIKYMTNLEISKTGAVKHFSKKLIGRKRWNILKKYIKS